MLVVGQTSAKIGTMLECLVATLNQIVLNEFAVQCVKDSANKSNVQLVSIRIDIDSPSLFNCSPN